jgi:hypothetical protein
VEKQKSNSIKSKTYVDNCGSWAKWASQVPGTLKVPGTFQGLWTAEIEMK